MADTRKPRTKPAPTGKGQSGRGSSSGTGTAAKNRRPQDKGKLARGAAARRLEEKRRRQRTLLWSGVAVLVLVALLAVIWFEGRSDTPQADNQSVSAAALEAGRTAAGSKGVQTFPEAGRDHIGPGEQPDNWNSTPPTSGDHLASPLPPGVYNSDQDMRALVHNLEHGYVVVVYKGIGDDQVAQLRQFVEARDGSKLVLAPWSGLESNGVALVAWRNLEVLERVNIDVVQAFVNDFMVPGASKSAAPEPNAA
jgi:Protein of unknown function (DUF3105)